MKVAIPTDSEKVSGHFGRCPEFTLAKIEDGEVKEKKKIDNPGHKPGYLPQFLNENQVDWLITGGIGRKAISMFENFGIEVTTGLEGEDTNKVLEQVSKGEIESGTNPCEPGRGKGYGVKREGK